LERDTVTSVTASTPAFAFQPGTRIVQTLVVAGGGGGSSVVMVEVVELVVLDVYK
jgi:hypothetical protein